MDLGRDDILRMLQAFQSTAILRSAIELGVFEQLAGGPADAPAVARAIGASERGTRILLDALAALGLLRRDREGYRLTAGAEDHLVRGRPAYLGELARIFASDNLWLRLQRLTEAVRRGGTVLQDHAETPGHPFWEDFACYSAALAGPAAEALAALLGSWAARRQPLEVLDVACGTGLYGFTLLKHQPHARLHALDWPNVLAISRGYADRLGVRDRVTFIEGDMFTAPLHGPYDLVIFSHVFHHFAEETCVGLLQRFATALKLDGRVVIHDFVPGDGQPGAETFARLFSVVMLVWTREGEAHALARYQQMLGAAGFGPATVHEPAGLVSRFLIADRLPLYAKQ